MKKIIIIFIILMIVLFFWFVPIVKVTVYGGCGMVYVPGKYNANCPSFSLNVSLKDFLLSKFVYRPWY